MKVKKLLASLLAATMLLGMMSFPAFAAAEPSLPMEDGIYIIANSEAYEMFCSDVANGVTYDGLTVKLTNDIITDKMVGDASRIASVLTGKVFKGIFDGGENTITFTYALDTNSNSQKGVGIFAGLDGAVVQNLNAAGTIEVKQSEYAVGGIAGYMVKGAEVRNCHVS